MNRFIILWMTVFFALSVTPAPGRAIDRTIAKINDDILTESDLAEVIAELRGEHRTAGIDAFAEATSVTVASMLDRQLLLQEARRLHINPSEEELHRQVEDTVREVKANFLSDKDFYHALAEERLSLDRFKEQLIKQTRDDFMVYHVVDSRFSVSDTEVTKYKNRDTTASPVKLRLRRLGIAITKKMNRQQACRKARSVVAQTITDGISFEEGVRRYSEVPGAAQDGGNMGYMALDDLSAEVSAAVKNLEVGQASAPVVAGDYANIFYVEGKRGARVAVREKKFVEARSELLQSLRRRAVLQVYDKRLLPLLPQEYLALTGEQSRQVRNSGVNHQDANPTATPAVQPAQQQSTGHVLFAPTSNASLQASGQTQSSPTHGQQPQAAPPRQKTYSTPGNYVQQPGYTYPAVAPKHGHVQQHGYAPQQQEINQQPQHGWFGRSR